MDTPLPNTVRRSPFHPASADTHSGRFVAARERAIRVLTDRYGDGLLSDEELELRLARLRAASDSAAMEALVADLGEPAPSVARSMDPPARWSITRSPVTALPPAPAEGRLLAVASETHRSGWWEVPRSLRVRAIMADVKLDLRDAPVPAGCTIDVSAYLASVTLIVLPGTTVAFDVFPMLGSAVSRAAPPGPVPHIRVTGSAFLAEVKVVARERK